MSWLARSIANSLKLDDDDDANEDEDDGDVATTSNDGREGGSPSRNEGRGEGEGKEEVEEEDEEDRLENQGRGVKEDLSELKQTLTRQLWGVASFLAPPPPLLPPPPHLSRLKTDRSAAGGSGWEMSVQSGSGDGSDEDAWEFEGDSGTITEFAINDGGFRDGVSNSSNLVDFGSGDLSHLTGEAAGVTEEVLAFARNIAHHPETWLDFPLSEEEDMDDFSLSEAQRKHALTVESLAPRLRALRIELCPAHMSIGYFWKVYFVLLHSRLHKGDAELLSTPQMVEARAMWMQELQKREKPDESDWFGRSTYSPRKYPDPNLFESPTAGGTTPLPWKKTLEPITDFETDKHPVVTTELQVIDKSIIEEHPKDEKFEAGPSYYKIPDFGFEDDDHGDDWLKEDSDLDGYEVTGMGNEEDVSFSDLEEDNDCRSMPLKPKVVLTDLNEVTRKS